MMKKYFFDIKTNGIVIDGDFEREPGVSTPSEQSALNTSDLIEITEDRYLRLLEGVKNGEIFYIDEEGLPAYKPKPPLTPEQLAEQAKAEAQAYLLSTDWVEPFLIKHELGIAILPENSNKLVIAKKRDEARELLK